MRGRGKGSCRKMRHVERNYKFPTCKRRTPGTSSSKPFLTSEAQNHWHDEKYETSVYKTQSLNLDSLQFHISIIKQSLFSRLWLDKYTFIRLIYHLYSYWISTHLVCISDFVYNLFVQPTFFLLCQCTHGGSAFLEIHELLDLLPGEYHWMLAKGCLWAMSANMGQSSCSFCRTIISTTGLDRKLLPLDPISRQLRLCFFTMVLLS